MTDGKEIPHCETEEAPEILDEVLQPLQDMRKAQSVFEEIRRMPALL